MKDNAALALMALVMLASAAFQWDTSRRHDAVLDREIELLASKEAAAPNVMVPLNFPDVIPKTNNDGDKHAKR